MQPFEKTDRPCTCQSGPGPTLHRRSPGLETTNERKTKPGPLRLHADGAQVWTLQQLGPTIPLRTADMNLEELRATLSKGSAFDRLNAAFPQRPHASRGTQTAHSPD